MNNDDPCILGSMPIILMNRRTNLIEVISIENFYLKNRISSIKKHLSKYKYENLYDFEDYLVWSVKIIEDKIIPTWTKIKSISMVKTKLRPWHLINCYNNIICTENTMFLLKTGNKVLINNIKENTKLYETDIPFSDSFPINFLENTQPDGGEIINDDIRDNIVSCNICNKLLLDGTNIVYPYFHCCDCSDYDICEDCLNMGYKYASHDEESHEIIKRYGYDMNTMLNNGIIEQSEKKLLNMRDPHRYFSILLDGFVDTQQKMILAKKCGYNAKIELENVLTYLSFDTSYDAIEEEFYYTNPSSTLNVNKYSNIIKDNYTTEFRSKPFLSLRSNRYNGRAHMFPFGNGVYVGNLFRHSYLVGEHYIYNSNIEYMFQIKTESGYFQCGIGGLILCV